MRIILYGLLALGLGHDQAVMLDGLLTRYPTMDGMKSIPIHVPLAVLTEGQCEVVAGEPGNETFTLCAEYFRDHEDGFNQVLGIETGVPGDQGIPLPNPFNKDLKWGSENLPDPGEPTCQRPIPAFPQSQAEARSLAWLPHACEIDPTAGLRDACVNGDETCPGASVQLDLSAASVCHFVHTPPHTPYEVPSYHYRHWDTNVPSGTNRAMADAIEVTISLEEPYSGKGEGIRLHYRQRLGTTQTTTLWLTPASGKLTVVLLNRPFQTSSTGPIHGHFAAQLTLGEFADPANRRVAVKDGGLASTIPPLDWMSCESDLTALDRFPIALSMAPPLSPIAQRLLEELSPHERALLEGENPLPFIPGSIKTVHYPDECMSNTYP